jgi:hypothetical protein
MTADASEGLLRSLEELERVAQSVTADEAARTLDEATRRRPTTVRSSTTSAERAAAEAEGTWRPFRTS